MKPKTKIQKEVFALSKRLPEINEIQTNIALNTSGAGLPKVLLPAPSADTNGKETGHWQTRFAVAPALIAEWN